MLELCRTELALDPAAAFWVFRHEIDGWWRRAPMNWNDPERAVGVRFGPGAGGRWIEVHDAATGEGSEMAPLSSMRETWKERKRS